MDRGHGMKFEEVLFFEMFDKLSWFCNDNLSMNVQNLSFWLH